MAAGVAELLLQLIERGLTVLDGVPHPLPRDAEVLGNFGQGQILIIVFCQDDALAGRLHGSAILDPLGHRMAL